MKPILLPLALLLLAQACDAPQQRRITGTFDNSSAASAGNSSGLTPTDGSNGSSNGGSSSGTTTGGDNKINCSNNVTAYHAGIGNVDICQDTANELSFRMGFSTTDQSDGTCIVPMYKDSAGNSTWLGSAQCTKHNQGQIVYGNVNKNRSGYAGYQINSVMVLKYSGTSAFFQCMNAYGTSYTSCMGAYGNNPYYQSYCNTQAQNYMTTLCNTFKANYPYAQVSTR